MAEDQKVRNFSPKTKLYRQDVRFKIRNPRVDEWRSGKPKEVGCDMGDVQGSRKVASHKCHLTRPTTERQVAAKEGFEPSEGQNVTSTDF